MRKVIIVSIISMMAFTVQAQRLSFGPEAGAGFNWHEVEVDALYGKEGEITRKSAFRGGAALEYSPWYWLRLSSGLFYTIKGTKEYPRQLQLLNGGGLSYSSLEIPLQLSYQKQYKSGNTFFVGLGPYMGYGIHGTLRRVVYSAPNLIRSDEPVKWGNDSGDHIRRVQWGMQVQTGWIHRSGLMLRFVAQTGFNDAPRGNIVADNGIVSVYNRIYAALTLGYQFRYKQLHKK